MRHHHNNTMTMTHHTILFNSFMMMAVTGHTKSEMSYQPFDRRVDIPYYDFPHAKELKLYHSYDWVDHDDHSHHPYAHLNQNNMQRFRKDMDDDIPTSHVKKSGVTTKSMRHHFSSEPTAVHLDPVALSLPKSVNALDMLCNSIIPPIDCDDQNDDEDNIHGYNTMMIAMANRSVLASSSTECVYNETQLRLAINSTPNSSPAKIKICSNYMPINASQPSFGTLQGIFINRKILDIHCNNCILDAQSLSRPRYIGTLTSLVS
jgi:hypothetical protein